MDDNRCQLRLDSWGHGPVGSVCWLVRGADFVARMFGECGSDVYAQVRDML